MIIIIWNNIRSYYNNEEFPKNMPNAFSKITNIKFIIVSRETPSNLLQNTVVPGTDRLRNTGLDYGIQIMGKIKRQARKNLHTSIIGKVLSEVSIWGQSDRWRLPRLWEVYSEFKHSELASRSDRFTCELPRCNSFVSLWLTEMLVMVRSVYLRLCNGFGSKSLNHP